MEVSLNKLLNPIREKFKSDAKLEEIAAKAYPPPLSKSALKKLEDKFKKDLKLRERAEIEGTLIFNNGDSSLPIQGNSQGS